MAKQTVIEQKAQLVNEVADKMKSTPAFIAFQYQGLTVEQFQNLRRSLLKDGCHISVIKNNISRRASEQLGYSEFADVLKGAIAIVFSGEDIAAGNSLYRVRFIKGILDDGKPERNSHCVQYHARSVRDQMRQRRKSLTVDRGAPVVLAAANGQHLAQTALDRTGKIRMRLDTAHRDHVVGCEGRLGEMHLNTVRRLTDDLCLHRRVDRNAHGLRSNAVIPEDLFLPL